MIRKVVYRTNDSSLGDQPNNWYGEDAYELHQRVMGKEITMIGYGFMFNDDTCVRIFVEDGKLFCEIPMTSVARIYYSLEDDTVSE